jgi:flagellar basal-body rod protein FlgF
MQNPTDIALSRLISQQRGIDVTAENIANANTPGYKAERMQFTDWLNRQHNIKGPTGGDIIYYTQDRATYRDQRSGPISMTGNPLDLAITGQGYFTLNTPNGPRLSRSGHFERMPDGTIADGAGNPLLDINGQPLQLAPEDTQIMVAGDGTLSTENGEIGQIGIVQPADPMQLSAEGNRLFLSNSPTSPVAQPNLTQGAIEESNVQPIIEMTRMLNDTRQFQMVTQFVQEEATRQQDAIGKILTPAA